MPAPDTKIVDSHCHLNFNGLYDDLEGVIERAEARGVGTMLAINTQLAAFPEVHDIARAHQNIFCSVGIHPHEAEREAGVALNDILEKAGLPKVVGIGETGLDYYYDNAPRDAQRRSFEIHVEAAQESGLPIIVHTRDAEADTLDVMTSGMARKPFSGVIHCFTASRDFAEKALDLGLYISLSGIVTFKNAKDIQETAKIIPLDRLLVETDSPYLAPVPHRGHPCEPAYVAETAAFVANLRDMPLDELARATTDNFFTLFAKATR